ncbi:hypothetical protein ABIF23_005116 [Bradyrhizobium elkanii]|uniref:hypothetical protein n=1 Tax=Bradyrhizobium elkanii TaxID=29448 RepID=UPI0035181FFF
MVTTYAETSEGRGVKHGKLAGESEDQIETDRQRRRHKAVDRNGKHRIAVNEGRNCKGEQQPD